MRYASILVLLIVAGAGLFKLSELITLWRTQPQQVQTADPAAIAKVLQTPMPATDAGLFVIEQSLSELGQQETLSALAQYSRQRWLARALGIDADVIPTVGAAQDWQGANPEKVHELQQRLLHEALEVHLASPNVSPPKAGRLGYNWNATFRDAGDGLWQQVLNGEVTNQHVFVVDVANHSQLPVHEIEYLLVPTDGAGHLVESSLPQHSYTWCGEFDGAGTGKSINPDDTLTMMCEIRVGAVGPVSVEALHQLINNFRIGNFAVWVKQLEIKLPDSNAYSDLQLRDRGVDAQFGHPPSDNVDTAYVGSADQGQARRRLPVKATTCGERGDCLKTWLQPFAGQVEIGWALILAMLPGYLVAGLARGLDKKSVAPAVFVYVLAAIILIPYAFHSLGSGYGGLIAMILIAFGTVGYWAGYFIGSWASSTPRAE